MKLSFEFADPITGKSNLCPIIFLHGIFGSKKAWRSVAPEICSSTRRRVYSLDARNHGDSPWTDDFTIQLMVDDVKEFLNEQNIFRAVFVGSNIGGSVVMKLALESPGLTEKIIVESMVPDPYPPRGWKILLNIIQYAKEALRQIQRGSSLFEARRVVADYIAFHTNLGSIDRADGFRLHAPLKKDNGAFKWEANFDAVEVALRTNEDFDGGLSGTYGGQTLFLYGCNLSNFRFAGNERIAALFPQAVYVAVQGAAFMVHDENPEEFVRYVTLFVNGQY